MQDTQEMKGNTGLTDSDLVGVHGWLLFFAIIFFLNALNIFSVPVGVGLIKWRAIWQESEILAVYFAVSSLVEFICAVTVLTAGMLIVMRRKAAVTAVNIYCILLAANAAVGIYLADSLADLLGSEVPVFNVVHYTKYLAHAIDMDLSWTIGASLYAAYVGIIVVALVFFLYFRFSKRVAATLTQ